VLLIASSCSISASDSEDNERQAVCACISPPEAFTLCGGRPKTLSLTNTSLLDFLVGKYLV
jgi:hypothetical protein